MRRNPLPTAAGLSLLLHGYIGWRLLPALRLPWNFFVPLQQPFVAGLERLKTLWVYTSRGTGYWGPPLRFLAPSEITHLRLVPASNGVVSSAPARVVAAEVPA
jgi:hypothetical protein